MINSFTIKSGVFAICFLIITNGFAQKDKTEKNIFLEGKKYDVNFTEVKTTGVAKPLPSVIEFRKGKVKCDLMKEKMAAPPMPYEIILDTTYVEDEEEVHKVIVKSEINEEFTSYKWDATIIDYEISGMFYMLKRDVVKKKFEFSGEETMKKR